VTLTLIFDRKSYFRILWTRKIAYNFKNLWPDFYAVLGGDASYLLL